MYFLYMIRYNNISRPSPTTQTATPTTTPAQILGVATSPTSPGLTPLTTALDIIIVSGVSSWSQSGHGFLIQFGCSLWDPLQRRNKRELLRNILNCPPIAEYLDPPHDVVPSRMSGSVTVY